MELIELENIWKEYDNKITNNTRLSKEILKRMLISKPEKRLNWIKIKAGINVFSPIILFILLLIMDVQFQLTAIFYTGLSLFTAIYIINYIWDIKYFLLIRKIDFTQAILSIRKGIAELEKYKIKTTRVRYILAPFAILGIFFMLFQKPIFNKEFNVFLVLVVLSFISSIYYTFKYSIFERFRKLNSEIEEIEMLEKE